MGFPTLFSIRIKQLVDDGFKTNGSDRVIDSCTIEYAIDPLCSFTDE
jgi:hypothetical protein